MHRVTILATVPIITSSFRHPLRSIVDEGEQRLQCRRGEKERLVFRDLRLNHRRREICGAPGEGTEPTVPVPHQNPGSILPPEDAADAP
jgi:hypothetical protein